MLWSCNFSDNHRRRIIAPEKIRAPNERTPGAQMRARARSHPPSRASSSKSPQAKRRPSVRVPLAAHLYFFLFSLFVYFYNNNNKICVKISTIKKKKEKKRCLWTPFSTTHKRRFFSLSSALFPILLSCINTAREREREREEEGRVSSTKWHPWSRRPL